MSDAAKLAREAIPFHDGPRAPTWRDKLCGRRREKLAMLRMMFRKFLRKL